VEGEIRMDGYRDTTCGAGDGSQSPAARSMLTGSVFAAQPRTPAALRDAAPPGARGIAGIAM